MRHAKQGKRVLFVFIFLLSLGICVFGTSAYIKNRSKLEKIEMEQLLSEKSEKITAVVTKLLYKTHTLAALVIQNNGEIRDFERVASTILDDPCIKNVLLAPNGVVTDVYPLEGNEQVKNLDFYKEGSGNKEAILAKETGDLVLGGPFELIQGGQALVGRLPVYLPLEDGNKKFWGIVSVTLNFPQALTGAELDYLKSQGFTYEIWRTNPDDQTRQTIVSASNDSIGHSRFVEKQFRILNAEWNFRLSPIKHWYQFPETWILTVVGIVVSLLFASLFIHNHELKKVQLELENLTFCDPLTNSLNRRGIFFQLQNLLKDSEKFQICYMDVNHFKEINDTYGHKAGDDALCRFVQSFQGHIGKKDMLGRIGGDEFVLVFIGNKKSQELLNLISEMQDILNKPMLINGDNKIALNFSFGIAAFPKDGSTIDELINMADQNMYRHKQANKS